jgi:hypothetical protein
MKFFVIPESVAAAIAAKDVHIPEEFDTAVVLPSVTHFADSNHL